MKKGLIAATVVIGLISVIAAVSMFRFMQQEKIREAFKPHVQEYLETDYAPAGDAAPYIRGRVVTVNTERKEVDDWTYPKLPQTIQARDPDAVDTVVLITWEKEKAGVYQDVETEEETGEAYRSKAFITLIDWQEKKIIAEKVFTGQEPLKGLSRDGDFTSQWPMFDVIDYLMELPRKE